MEGGKGSCAECSLIFRNADGGDCWLFCHGCVYIPCGICVPFTRLWLVGRWAVSQAVKYFNYPHAPGRERERVGRDERISLQAYFLTVTRMINWKSWLFLSFLSAGRALLMGRSVGLDVLLGPALSGWGCGNGHGRVGARWTFIQQLR